MSCVSQLKIKQGSCAGFRVDVGFYMGQGQDLTGKKIMGVLHYHGTATGDELTADPNDPNGDFSLSLPYFEYTPEQTAAMTPGLNYSFQVTIEGSADEKDVVFDCNQTVSVLASA